MQSDNSEEKSVWERVEDVLSAADSSSRDPIIEAVRMKFLRRSIVGIEKYGKTLARDDLELVDWLTHLQEELMDSVAYIEVVLQQIGKINDE